MRMESPDLIQKNIEKIEQLFPNVITEVKDNRGGGGCENQLTLKN